MDLNELAQHEAKRAGEAQPMCHPASCGCFSTRSRRTSTVTAAYDAKAFPSKQPQKISH